MVRHREGSDKRHAHCAAMARRRPPFRMVRLREGGSFGWASGRDMRNSELRRESRRSAHAMDPNLGHDYGEGPFGVDHVDFGHVLRTKLFIIRAVGAHMNQSSETYGPMNTTSAVPSLMGPS